ncbi:Bgr_08870 family protein [Bartonella sp. B12(2025)]
MAKTDKLNMELPKEGRFISSEFPILRENLTKIDQAIADIETRAKEKAPSQHVHTISDVTGLETALKAKMPAEKSFSLSELADVEGAQDAANNYVLYKSSNNNFTFGSAKSLLGAHQHKVEDIVGLETSYGRLASANEWKEANNFKGKVTINGKAIYTKNEASAALQEIYQAMKEMFPPGFIAAFAMQEVPSGWLLCDGATYEREDYPQLFKAIGDKWGKRSDTTFKVPDFRGIFLRGFDDGRGVDPNRQFAYIQQGSIESHTHFGFIEEAGEHTHQFQYNGVGMNANDIGHRNPYYRRETISDTTKPAGAHTHGITISATGEAETRPVNATVVYAIKS